MWKKKWASAEGKFPGAKASLEDKLEWLYWVNSGEMEESQFELLFDHTRPHDTQAVANEILYDNCTPKVPHRSSTVTPIARGVGVVSNAEDALRAPTCSVSTSSV
jgi:hypothetical protein